MDLQTTMLFRGMPPGELNDALFHLSAREKPYVKGAVILHSGDVTADLGLVLRGSVTIESNDLWGNRTILSHVPEGQLFAETYALLKSEPLLVDVLANEECRVLFLRAEALSRLSPTEPWVAKLMRNLLLISANKNLHLSGRSFHTAPKSIRGRLLSYLNSVALRTGRHEFTIPFDRQQLADYLNVERTALSKELGKMRAEGLIDCHKNRFRLITE